MSRWMSGERSPKISDVEKMAKVLDMEIRLYKRGDAK
jgi:transcriptional regulator with XRE-family HTH domain